MCLYALSGISFYRYMYVRIFHIVDKKKKKNETNDFRNGENADVIAESSHNN